MKVVMVVLVALVVVELVEVGGARELFLRLK